MNSIYGNGNYPTSMKGDTIAAPLGSISHEVSKHFPTVMTSEYKTSKLCRTCKEKLERVLIPSVRLMKRDKMKVDNINPLKENMERKLHNYQRPGSKITSQKKKKVKMKLDEGLSNKKEQLVKVVQLAKNYRLLKCPKHNCDSIAATLRQARRLEKGLPKCKTGKHIHTYDRDENAVFNPETVFKSYNQLLPLVHVDPSWHVVQSLHLHKPMASLKRKRECKLFVFSLAHRRKTKNCWSCNRTKYNRLSSIRIVKLFTTANHKHSQD